MTSTDVEDESPKLAKRTKRSYVACGYIEKLRAENAELRKAAPQSNGNGNGDKLLGSPLDSRGQAATATSPDTEDCREDDEEAAADVADPLLEDRLTTQNDCTSSRLVYVGGAACTAFVTRLGFHIRGNNHPNVPCVTPMLKHPGFQRSIQYEVNLPSRAYTQVLVQVVLRFIGQDYHLLRRKSFFEQIDRIYQDPDEADNMSLCKLFVVLALGELYLKKTCSIENGERVVPGTKFFIQAISLLQDQFEEPDINYIETLLLLSFYSHALNRKNTAYTYAGLALRLSLTLGLHRNITYDPATDPAEIENRRRVWWTVYTFDRLCSSKLGHAVMIKDEDIDVPLPSPKVADEDFMDPKQLISNVKLSKITGSILNLIYGVPTQRSGDFIRNVHTILNNLKQWDAELPPELKLNHQRFPSYGSRPVASLRLHFNQCIILTTRPVLLHVFNHYIKSNRLATGGSPASTSAAPSSPPPPPSSSSSKAAAAGAGGPPSTSSTAPKPLSPMTVALSEACIYAARATANLLGQLWADGSIATFGFFDSHYAFSSTAVLIMSNLLRANDADRDAIALSRALLQSMVDDGNLPAREFHGRLAALQRDVDEALLAAAARFPAGPGSGSGSGSSVEYPLPGGGGGGGSSKYSGASSGNGIRLGPTQQSHPQQQQQPPPLRGYVTSTGTFAANVSRGGEIPHHQVRIENGGGGGSGGPYRMPGTLGNVPVTSSEVLSAAPLDAPFIQDFLGNFDTNWSPGDLNLSNDEEVPWALSWEAADPV